MNSPMLTLDEICKILRISKATAYRHIRKGNIPGAFRIGNMARSEFRINTEQFEAWMRKGFEALYKS